MSDTQPRVPAGVPTGGRYAAAEHPEVGFVLDLVDTPGYADAEHVALAAALAERLPGQVGFDNEPRIAYRDRDGHDYTILPTDGGFAVHADDVDVDSLTMWMTAPDADAQADKVADAVRRVGAEAALVRRFNAAAEHADGTGRVRLDRYTGVLYLGDGSPEQRAVIGNHTVHAPETPGRSVDITIGPEPDLYADNDGRRFSLDLDSASGEPGAFVLYRDGGVRLTDWEARAVLDEVDRRAGAPLRPFLRALSGREEAPIRTFEA